MAKASGSAPDPPAESEDSGEEATTEEEAEENGGSGSESDTESEQEKSKLPDNSQPTKKPLPAPAKKPETLKPPSPDTSSAEDDSGSDSESDSLEAKPDPNIKPIASKPAETTAAPKKPKSKANSSPTITNSAAGSKRPATSETGVDGEVKETKRVKKKPEKYVEELEKKGSSNDDSRKLFQRLWSEDDEIAILKGMIDYSSKKKADPVANLDAFHEFIKKSLHIDVSRTQLQDKIRRLRKKYVNNADKEKNGKERIFAKDHEQKSFELSKKVWGNENSNAGKKMENPKYNGEVVTASRSKNSITKKPLNEVKEEDYKDGKILISEKTSSEEGLKYVKLGLQKNLGIEEWIMENSQFVDEEKRAKMDEKWKNFKIVEAEFYAKKLELMLEETKMISEALKSSAS